MALLIIATALHVLFPAQSSLHYSSIYLSAALVSSGFAVMMLAWWQFKERKVAICPTANTDYLITNGIYRLTRNPMYLGMVTMLGGVASFFGTLPFYAVAIVYFILIDRWFCMYEEEKLVATFGRDYVAYRSKVRRWL
ncbi:MAG: protein-S-isoprenylcysteine O-methyltransferase Ste14 [Woeseiaceae bacterium]|jgi:protein-S-isoprenylcysteine O-methyltransferase Ste14